MAQLYTPFCIISQAQNVSQTYKCKSTHYFLKVDIKLTFMHKYTQQLKLNLKALCFYADA